MNIKACQNSQLASRKSHEQSPLQNVRYPNLAGCFRRGSKQPSVFKNLAIMGSDLELGQFPFGHLSYVVPSFGNLIALTLLGRIPNESQQKDYRKSYQNEGIFVILESNQITLTC